MSTTGEAGSAAMEPWEQHHAVINMPRYAYNPASVMLHNAGFLITCTFRREKSATKEILALLKEYMNFAENGNKGNPGTGWGQLFEDEDDSVCSKTAQQPAEEGETVSKTGSMVSSEDIRPIPCPAKESDMSSEKPKMENGSAINIEDSLAEKVDSVPNEGQEDIRRSDDREEGACIALDPVTTSDERDLESKAGGDGFTLVKLATMGVIYICTSGKFPSTVLSAASRMVKDVQAGTRAAPQWCHRMLPVQATCPMKREELQAIVSRLVKVHLRDHVPSGEQPMNFAVAFNKRGGGVTKSDTQETTVLGRDECIKIVTAAVEQVTTSIKVDLTSPQMVVFVELIPVAGVQSSLICAVSVLPGDLTLSKPKLNVKPLARCKPKPRKRKRLR